MPEIYLYTILVLASVLFLNSHFNLSRPKVQVQQYSNLMIVEHLAQYSSKPKNYRRSPKNFQEFGYGIKGVIEDQIVKLDYRFPLIDDKEVEFKVILDARNTSSTISQFGGHNSYFAPVDASSFQLTSSNRDYLLDGLNKDGFYFKDFDDWGLDYNHVIDISEDLCIRIAHFIVLSLQERGKDSYFNRVKASLSFVQYIPYGVPKFDEADFTYFGLALPHESMGISYSDCDSKSALMAGILKNMIATENIVLIICTMDGVGHMITGVSGLHLGGKTIKYKNKEYTLLETTVPNPIGYDGGTEYSDLNIIPLN